jgi:hypothetical protein
MTTDNKIDFETKYYIIMLVGAETKYYIIMLVGAITLITLCLSVLIGFPISQLWVFRGMTVEDRESFFNKLDATCNDICVNKFNASSGTLWMEGLDFLAHKEECYLGCQCDLQTNVYFTTSIYVNYIIDNSSNCKLNLEGVNEGVQ